MKTTVEIPDSLFKQIKATAARQGVPLKAVVVDALRQWLSPQHGQSKPFKYRKHSFRGEGLVEGLSEHDWAEIRGRAYEGHGG